MEIHRNSSCTKVQSSYKKLETAIQEKRNKIYPSHFQNFLSYFGLQNASFALQCIVEWIYQKENSKKWKSRIKKEFYTFVEMQCMCSHIYTCIGLLLKFAAPKILATSSLWHSLSFHPFIHSVDSTHLKLQS